MDSLIREMRYGARTLWKNRMFAAIVIMTLALGIGVNAAIFSLLDSVMLRTLPVHDPGKLVLLQWRANQNPTTNSSYYWSGCPENEQESAATACSFSYPMYQEIRTAQNVFSGVVAFAGPASIRTTLNHQSSYVDADFVSGNFFSVLGVSMLIGRPLELGDDQPTAPLAAILGHGYWQQELGGDRSIVGKTIMLNGTPVIVAGVASPEFQGLDPGIPKSMWLPLSSQPRLVQQWPKQSQPDSLWVQMVARLKSGVTIAEAESAIGVIFQRNVTNGAHPIFPVSARPEIRLHNASLGLATLRQEFKTPLLVLMATVSLILLIACANVAGLMLVRGKARQREVAIRLALGARRSAIFRQLLTEAVILTALGGSVGLLFAYWMAASIASFLSSNFFVALKINVHPDLRVLAFTFLISLVTGVLFSLAPGFSSSRLTLVPALKQDGLRSAALSGQGSRVGIGSTLVVAQVALSILILSAAGLLVRTLVDLETMNPGFDSRDLLIFNVGSTDGDYKGKRLTDLYQNLQTRLGSLPGVTGTSYSMTPLLRGISMNDDFSVASIRGDGKFTADVLSIGPGFFETMHIPLVAGRTFTAADLYSEVKPARAIVNQILAERLFGKENPVGKRFSPMGSSTDAREIIGVVGDAKYDDLKREIGPTVYLLFQQDGGAFELRTAGDPKAIIPLVRHVISQIDSALPVTEVQTQAHAIDKTLYQERLVAALSSLFGLLALTLAGIGLYGLLSYDAVSRTREIGIRIALGARPHHVLQLVIRRGTTLAGIGAISGIAMAAGLTRYLRSLLYGVKPTDPVSFIVAGTLLLIVALLACYLPARRASKIDPMAALRCE